MSANANKQHLDPFGDIWGGSGSPVKRSPRVTAVNQQASPASSTESPGGTGSLSTTTTMVSNPRSSAAGSTGTLSPRRSTGGRPHGSGGASEGTGTISPRSSQGIADRMYKRLSADEPPPPPRPTTQGANGGKSKNGAATRPQLLVCYLCGQQFGTASLDIHQPQCYVKKLLQWERNPSEFRGGKPLSPDEYKAKRQSTVEATGALPGRQSIEKFNEMQFEGYTDQLVPCSNCGRTFLPDRLEVHARSCKGPGRGSKPVRRGAPSTSQQRSAASTSPPTATAATRRSPGIQHDDSDASDGIGGNGGKPTVAPYERTDSPMGRTLTPSGEEERLAQPPAGAGSYPPPTLLETHSPQKGTDGVSSSAGSSTPPQQSLDEVPVGLPKPTDTGGGEEKDRSPASPAAVRPKTVVPKLSTSAMGKARSSTSDAGSPAAPTSSPQKKAAPSAGSPKKASPTTRVSLHERMQANLVRCQYCNRTFAPDRVEKHERVCLAQKTVQLAKTPGHKGPGPLGGSPSVSPNSSFGAPGGQVPLTARGNGGIRSSYDAPGLSMGKNNRTRSASPDRRPRTAGGPPSTPRAGRLTGATAAASPPARIAAKKPATAKKAKVPPALATPSESRSPSISSSSLTPPPSGTSAASGAAGRTGAATSPPHSHHSPALREARREKPLSFVQQHSQGSTGSAPDSSPTLEASFSELEEQLREFDSRRRGRSPPVAGVVPGCRDKSPNSPAASCLPPPVMGSSAPSSEGEELKHTDEPSEHAPTPPEGSSRTSPPPATIRFCGECGAKLLSASQKFCCECGGKIPGHA